VKPLNILLADDTESVGLFVASYLRDAGHAVTYVPSGEAAVAAFRQGAFDLVLMDVVMPGLGGIEAVRQIKAIPTTAWVPVIMITGADSDEDLLAGFLAGADDYILKPLNPLTLDIRIRAMMRIAGIQRSATAVIDNALDGIVQIDTRGRIQRFNRAAERIFGYGEAEVLGKNVNMLMPSPDREQHDGYLAVYLTTGQEKIIGIGRQVTGLRRNGETFPMHLGVSEANTVDGRFFVGVIRDLTVEEHLRAQLAEKSAELEGFFSLAPDLFCIASIKGRFKKLNAAWETVLGYPPSELEERNILDYVHPEDHAASQEALRRLNRGEPLGEFIHRFRGRDGTYRHIEWRAVLVGDGMMHASARDVSESLLREQALAEREHFMRLLIDVIPGMVGYWNRDLRCRFANRGYLEWFGKTPEEMWDIPIQQLLGGELYRQNEPRIRGALAGEPQHFERTLVKADGSIGYTWAHYIPDEVDGRVNGFFVLVSDVSDIKAAEAALRENRRFLSDLIEHSGTLIFAKDQAGRYLLVNRKYEESTGMARDAVLGRTDGELYPEAIARGFREHDLQVMAAGASAEMEETLAERSYLTIKFPLRNEAGEVNGVCGISTDITERKKAQLEIERLSQVDVLTGLSNRRHFMVLAEREVARTTRYGGALATLMMDIDHFKVVNDTYGHGGGDVVLAEVARRCRSSLRDVDLLGRLGGEEFAVLLPETSLGWALEVADRLRRGVSATPVLLRDGRLVTVTLSIGVAAFGGAGSDLDGLLGRADKALYRAKESGRNRVVSAA